MASGRPPVPVFFGAWFGLAVVSGLAILLGRWLLKRVKLSLVRYVGATVCAILAVITLIEALTRSVAPASRCSARFGQVGDTCR